MRPLVVMLVGPKSVALARAEVRCGPRVTMQYLADCPTGPWHEQACLNFTLIPLHPIENVQWGRPTRLRVSRHNDSFSKLYVFGERIGFRPCPHRQRLTIEVPAGFKAKRVVFLDADTIVLRNIDALFNTAKAVDDDDGKDGSKDGDEGDGAAEHGLRDDENEEIAALSASAAIAAIAFHAIRRVPSTSAAESARG